MPENTVVRSQDVIQSLSLLYTFKPPAEVSAFLEQYPFLVAILEEAYPKIRHYFPEGELTLEPEPNPWQEGQLRLVLTVHSVVTRGETAINFNDLKLNWWLYTYEKTQEKMTIAVDHESFDEPPDPMKVLKRLMGKYEMPTDWSSETDHYLRGTPKRGKEPEA